MISIYEKKVLYCVNVRGGSAYLTDVNKALRKLAPRRRKPMLRLMRDSLLIEIAREADYNPEGGRPATLITITEKGKRALSTVLG